MPSLRLGTFNVENLFARFKFNKNVDPDKAVKDGWDVSKTHFDLIDEASKRITGALIRSTQADVLCLQEVENLDTLKAFRARYIGGGRSTYPYVISIDGNDKRLIDVAVLSKYPIVAAHSNQELRQGRSYIFSRDCLELEIDVDGSPLYLFVNHLKSMLDKRDPANGRRNTFAKRQLQAQTVRKIVGERFGTKAGSKPFVALGDMNDYMQVDEFGEPAIGDLVEWNQVENVVCACQPTTSGRTIRRSTALRRPHTSSSTTCWCRNRWRRRTMPSRRSSAKAWRATPSATPARDSQKSGRASRLPRTTAR